MKITMDWNKKTDVAYIFLRPDKSVPVNGQDQQTGDYTFYFDVFDTLQGIRVNNASKRIDPLFLEHARRIG